MPPRGRMPRGGFFCRMAATTAVDLHIKAIMTTFDFRKNTN